MDDLKNDDVIFKKGQIDDDLNGHGTVTLRRVFYYFINL